MVNTEPVDHRAEAARLLLDCQLAPATDLSPATYPPASGLAAAQVHAVLAGADALTSIAQQVALGMEAAGRTWTARVDQLTAAITTAMGLPATEQTQPAGGPADDPVGTVRRHENGTIWTLSDDARAPWVRIVNSGPGRLWADHDAMADTTVIGAVPDTPAAQQQPEPGAADLDLRLADVERAETTIAQLTTQVDELRAERDELTAQRDRANQTSGQLGDQLDELRAQLSRAVVLPTDARGQIERAIVNRTGWVSGETANIARDLMALIESWIGKRPETPQAPADAEPEQREQNSPAVRYWVAPDADDWTTLWRGTGPDDDAPTALFTQDDLDQLDPALWPILVQTLTGPDEDTIERVAHVLAEESENGDVFAPDWADLSDEDCATVRAIQAGYRDMARAALKAARQA